MTGTEISFPNLGITLENVKSGFDIFGFHIAFYGVIIAFGMMAGFMLVTYQAKKTGQNTEMYLDFALYAIICSVIGARIYYVIFSWDEYKNNPIEVFNIRGGGLAIYGGVIAGILTAVVFSKVRKVKFTLLADTACLGLITGQIIGRWGNFFNTEAFGGYAGNSLFAMQIPWEKAVTHMSGKSAEQLSAYVVDGTILVHPTFLYESIWNLCALIFLLWYSNHKKFDGEIILLYLLLYGVGRSWIEGLRTDQLLLWGTQIPVSQGLAILMAAGAAIAIFVIRMKMRKTTEKSK